MKLAFLFLTGDDHNQGQLWEAFFKGAQPEKYSIFCHPKFPDRITQPFLKNNIIPELIETEHAGISLVRATRLLLASALQDPQNDGFILLSESCIPLFDFNQIHDALEQTGKSIISYNLNTKNIETFLRWDRLKNKSFAPSDKFAKQHQWMYLRRELAEIILKHDHTDIFEDVYASDEHYFINLLINLNLPLEDMVSNRQVTFVNWQDSESKNVIKQNSSGESYTMRIIRPKIYQQLSPEDILAAKKKGMFFFRKVSKTCDVSWLTTLIDGTASDQKKYTATVETAEWASQKGNRTALTAISLDFGNGITAPFVLREGDSDKAVLHQIFAQRDYDLARLARYGDIRAEFQRIIDSRRTPLIIDCGANIGASPVWFSNSFPEAQIFAVEPERYNYEILRMNCKTHQNIKCRNAAISSVNETVYVQNPGAGSWAFRTIRDSGPSGTAVRAVTVASIEKLFPESKLFLIKIDIEGGESRLFESNLEWIDRTVVIIIELHDWMLPGSANSQNCLKALSARHRDFVFFGENVFSIRNH